MIHHGLVLGPDGKKLSKRHGHSSIAELREEGFPAAAVRAYLDELDLPEHDVQLDLARLRRLAVDAIAAMPDEELAAAADAPVEVVPALRGARSLAEAREYARLVVAPRAGRARRRRSADARAVRRAPGRGARAAVPRRGESDPPRAQGGRRRSALAPACTDGRRSRPRARSRSRRTPARRGTRAHRLTTIGAVRLYDTLTRSLVELPPAAGPDRDLLVRPDGLPAHPRRERLCGDDPAALAQALARGAGLRDEAGGQHHRHQRQDLRRRPGCERPARGRRDSLVRGGHGSTRSSAAPTSSQRRSRRSRSRSR